MRPTPNPIRIVARLDCGVVDCVASASALLVVEGRDTSSALVGVGATKTVVKTVVMEVAEGVVRVVSMDIVLAGCLRLVIMLRLDSGGTSKPVEVEYSACNVPTSEVLIGGHME